VFAAGNGKFWGEGPLPEDAIGDPQPAIAIRDIKIRILRVISKRIPRQKAQI
jgi:hypothetical protein